MEGWHKEDNGFPIIYNWLEHVGITRALNSGVNLANTDWFMILDSDDHLEQNAVEKLLFWLVDIKNDPSFVGVGLRGIARLVTI